MTRLGQRCNCNVSNVLNIDKGPPLYAIKSPLQRAISTSESIDDLKNKADTHGASTPTDSKPHALLHSRIARVFRH